MTFLKSVWDDITHGRNIDVYLALVLGIGATIGGVLGISPEIIANITTGILALLAFSMLSNREEAAAIKATLRRLEQAVIPVEKILIKENTAKEFSEIISSANEELRFLVRSGNTLRAHYGEIEAAVKRGCRLKIVVCQSNETIVNLLAFRGYTMEDTAEVRAELQQSTARLVNLARRITVNPADGQIEIKTIPYIPSVTIYMCDPDSDNGKVFAPVSTFRSPSVRAPGIWIDRLQDELLFDFLRHEFENYWKAGNPIYFDK